MQPGEPSRCSRTRRPKRIDDLIESLVEFADPILDGTADTLTWEPTERTWQPGPVMTSK